MALDKELRRRDVLFSLAEIERCPFSETNGTELDYLLCFWASYAGSSNGDWCGGGRGGGREGGKGRVRTPRMGTHAVWVDMAAAGLLSFPFHHVSSLWHYCGHMQTTVGKFSFILLAEWEQNKLYPVGLALKT